MGIEENTSAGAHYFAILSGGTNSECPTATGGKGGQGWYKPEASAAVPPKRGGGTLDNSEAGGLPEVDINQPNGAQGASRWEWNGLPDAEDGENGAGGQYAGQIVDNVWVLDGADEDGTDGEDGQSGGGGAYRAGSGIVAASPGGGGGSVDIDHAKSHVADATERDTDISDSSASAPVVQAQHLDSL